MASFEAVTKTLLKRSGGLNKSLAPNNCIVKKIYQTPTKVLLLIRTCWKEFFSKINKCAALLFGTLEYRSSVGVICCSKLDIGVLLINECYEIFELLSASMPNKEDVVYITTPKVGF